MDTVWTYVRYALGHHTLPGDILTTNFQNPNDQEHPIPATHLAPGDDRTPATHSAPAEDTTNEAPPSQEFPELSERILNTITALMLRTITAAFPGDDIYDYDVLFHFRMLAEFEDEIADGDEEAIKALLGLGLTGSRLLILQHNLRLVAMSLQVDYSSLWKVDGPKRIMLLIVQGADSQFDAGNLPFLSYSELIGAGAGSPSSTRITSASTGGGMSASHTGSRNAL